MAEPTADPEPGHLDARRATPEGLIRSSSNSSRSRGRARMRPSTADAVERARDSLEETLAGLKLTPEEEQALAERAPPAPRADARSSTRTTIEIAAFGMVSRGKSSVLNALLGRTSSRSAPTHGTTVVAVGPALGARRGRAPRPRAGAGSSWSTRRASTRSAARSARPWPATSPGTPT